MEILRLSSLRMTSWHTQRYYLKNYILLDTVKNYQLIIDHCSLFIYHSFISKSLFTTKPVRCPWQKRLKSHLSGVPPIVRLRGQGFASTQMDDWL